MRFIRQTIFVVLSGMVLLAAAYGRPQSDTPISTVSEVESPSRGAEAKLLELKPDHLVVELKFGGVIWSTTGDSIPDIPGLMRSFQPGEPRLPVSVHIFQIPPSKVRVTILESEREILHSGHIPAWVDDSGTGEYWEKPSIYLNDSFYPQNPVEVQRIGRFRGREIARLAVYPLRYNPQRGEVIYLRRMKIRVDFSDIEGVPGRRLSGRAEKTLMQILSDFPETSVYPCAPENPPSMPETLGSDEGIKVAVSQEGLFRITYQALVDSGIVPSTLGDPRDFKLRNRGEDVPIYVFGEADGIFGPGDYIDFWGEPNRKTYLDVSPDMYKDPWSDVNIYWLTWGGSPGAHMIEESVEIFELDPTKYYRPYNYFQTLHIEADNFFFRLGQVGLDSIKDHWYYDSGIDANETKTYNFWLPHPDVKTVQTAQLKVILMGFTYPVPYSNIGYHYATVSVNNYSSSAMEAGAKIGDVWPWVGQTLWVVETEGEQGIPHEYLHHGTNSLRVTSWGNTPSGNVNTVLMNWFEITYPRKYTPDEGYIRFTAPADGPIDTLYNFVVEEFPTDEIVVYKLGSSRLTNYTVEQNPLSEYYRLTFQDRLYGGEEYAAMILDSVKSPDWLALDQPSNLASTINQAEFLAICHPSFMENEKLNDLIARRSQNGAMLIDIEDIYDEFNWGIQNPEAIRNFLQYAYYYWADPKPFNVLLVGDGSWDQKDYGGFGGNLIPSYYMQTLSYGYSASDYWMTLLDGDDYIPEMTIGRVPAREEEEVDFYFDKVEQYEVTPIPGSWHNRYLFVSGGEGGYLSFQEQAQAAIDILPHTLFVERLELHSDTSLYFGGTAELSEFFNTGVSIVSYNGHGGGSRWGTYFFTVADVGDLVNQGLFPFIANFTCYICQYDVLASRTTLGEEFIFGENKGALGVYGSTGIGWSSAGGMLQQAMSSALNSNERLTQGELVLMSKINFLGMQLGYGGSTTLDGEQHATIFNMIFLGEPGVVIATPENHSSIPMDWMISGDNPIDIEMNVPAASGQAVARVYDHNSYPVFSGGAIWQSFPFYFDAGVINCTLDPNIVEFPARGSFRISYYSMDGGGDGDAFADFYTEDFFIDTDFDSLSVIPDPVTDADSARFSCLIIDQQEIVWAMAAYNISEFSGGEIVLEDTVDMYLVDPDYLLWETDPLPPFTGCAGHSLDFSFMAMDIGGDTAYSSAISKGIYDHRPDLFIDSENISLGGLKDMRLMAAVGNLTYNPVDSVLVEFWAGNEKYKSQMVGSTWIYDVVIGELVFAEVHPEPLLEEGEYQIYVVADPDNLTEDLNTGNNSVDLDLIVDRFEVDSSAGSNVNGVNRTFHYLEDYRFNIAPGAVEDSTLLIAEEVEDLVVQQTGLMFFDTTRGLHLSFSGLSDILLTGDGCSVDIRFSTLDTTLLDSMAIHFQVPGDSGWTKLPTIFSSAAGGYIWAQTQVGALGLFALMLNEDNIPPVVEITVDGQVYSEGSYVPSSPRINVVFHDLGGVNPNSIWAMIDGDTLDGALLMPPVAMGGGYSVSTNIHETFLPGNHTITFSGTDLSGNVVIEDFEITVAGDFDFKFVGNYPNPFKNKTIFSYSLTDQPDGDIVVKIYTVAGRLIRSLRQPAKINYDEIVWDCRDDEGNSLANGVYFCRIKTHKGDKTVERTLKLAKVR